MILYFLSQKYLTIFFVKLSTAVKFATNMLCDSNPVNTW